MSVVELRQPKFDSKVEYNRLKSETVNLWRALDALGRRIDSLERGVIAKPEAKAEEKSSYPSMTAIKRAVCDFFGLTDAELVSSRQTASLVLPRHIFFYLCRANTLRSLMDIGGFIGGRDHATVLHGVKKIEKRIAADPELVDELRFILGMIP